VSRQALGDIDERVAVHLDEVVGALVGRRWLAPVPPDGFAGLAASFQCPPSADDLRLLYVDKRLRHREIGARYGVTTATVRDWLRTGGIRRRPPGWARTVSGAWLRALYIDQELTAKQIAAREQVTTGMVRQALGHHRIRRRPRRSAISRPSAAELRRLYLTERRSLEDIGQRYGVTAWTAQRWLREARIGRKRPTRTRLLAADRLWELYVDQHMTIAQVARRERVAPNTVWMALIDYGIPRHPPGRHVPPRPPTATLRRLYLEDRWTIRQLATRHRVSYTTMRTWLEAAGIPLRPAGGSSRWHSRQSPHGHRTAADAPNARPQPRRPHNPKRHGESAPDPAEGQGGWPIPKRRADGPRAPDGRPANRTPAGDRRCFHARRPYEHADSHAATRRVPLAGLRAARPARGPRPSEGRAVRAGTSGRMLVRRARGHHRTHRAGPPRREALVRPSPGSRARRPGRVQLIGGLTLCPGQRQGSEPHGRTLRCRSPSGRLGWRASSDIPPAEPCNPTRGRRPTSQER
jgi:hypothetical protein